VSRLEKKIKTPRRLSEKQPVRKAAKNRLPANEGGARDKILQAAREVFTVHSFKEASTRIIAQKAGVEHPLIHYYFGSKENLFYEMAETIYNETLPVQKSWYDGLEQMAPEKGFSLFLDRMLEYGMAKPDALRIAALNMVNIGNIEEIPGHRFIILSMAATKRVMEEKLALRGPSREIEMFIYCFYSLMISLVGARSCQAQILNMDPLEETYRSWVKDAAMTLFFPWFKKILANR
jgi:AcrR family transcriptional regulator